MFVNPWQLGNTAAEGRDDLLSTLAGIRQVNT